MANGGTSSTHSTPANTHTAPGTRAGGTTPRGTKEMAHRFTFTVEVELERSEGKFAARDEMADAIIDMLEGAEDGVYGIGSDGDSSYDVTGWSVSEA